MSQNEVLENGWTAVPLDGTLLFNGRTYKNAPTPLMVSEIEFPSYDPIVAKIQQYAKEKLPLETYNHSMRVYYYATTIVRQQFPTYVETFSPSTLALTCLLHDIGTVAKTTRMSFEFYGAMKAHNVMRELGSSEDQADAVCEAIIRHQDLGNVGTITFLGQVIQLATIFDNVSDHPHLPHIENLIDVKSREDAIQAFPRTGWLGCFARTVKDEIHRKPWCHTTHIDNFSDLVLGNKLMAQYE